MKANDAWLELLHAEVAFALRTSGVDAIAIKGPSIKQWLYPDDERVSVDVDVLVRPSQYRVAQTVLTARGFREKSADWRLSEGASHSREYFRDDSILGRHEVDLHRFISGMQGDLAENFDELWGRRMLAVVAAANVWFPDLTSRALISTLQLGRDPRSPTASEDVRRLCRRYTPDDWSEVVGLAFKTGSAGPLRASFGVLQETRWLESRYGLAEVARPKTWSLASSSSDQTAVRLAELASIPVLWRPKVVFGWLFPSPAFLRARYPWAVGASRVTLAYAMRLSDAIKRAPRAFVEYRSRN